MKSLLTATLAVSFLGLMASCSSGPNATTGTAVGAVGGTVVAGPVGGAVGAVAGNAMGREEDRRQRARY